MLASFVYNVGLVVVLGATALDVDVDVLEGRWDAGQGGRVEGQGASTAVGVTAVAAVAATTVAAAGVVAAAAVVVTVWVVVMVGAGTVPGGHHGVRSLSWPHQPFRMRRSWRRRLQQRLR